MLVSEKQAIEAKLDPDAVDQQVGWVAGGTRGCCLPAELREEAAMVLHSTIRPPG